MKYGETTNLSPQQHVMFSARNTAKMKYRQNIVNQQTYKKHVDFRCFFFWKQCAWTKIIRNILRWDPDIVLSY